MDAATSESGTLLVVDDNRANIDQVVHHLADYDVIACTSGEEALQIIAGEHVDLVLLDIVMPGIDGFEVCRRLKAAPETGDIPVIFITARDDERHIDAAFQAGGYDYVTKPLRKTELLARVHTQLIRYRQYRELARARNALFESEERYRLAMDVASDGLWDWDIPSGGVYYSPGWSRIVGESEVAGEYASWETRIHPHDRNEVLAALKSHLDGRTQDWAVTHRLHHADGSWLWVMGRGRVVDRDPAGRPLRMVGTMTDIDDSKRNQLLTELRQALAELVYSDDLHTLMRRALDTAEFATGSEIGFYHFVEEDQNTIALQVWSTRTLKEMCFAEDHEQHYPVSSAGVWVDCIHQRQAVVHNDYEALPHKKGLPEGHPPVRCELTVPVFREGRIVAVMGVGNKEHGYNEKDKDIVYRIADMTHDFVERKRIEERIAFMAFNDSLTGLPNKELLHDRLQQAMANGRRTQKLLAVCYLDLDGFKPVNDQYGHHAGDALLVELAGRLRAALRDGDTVARLGGDEFVILMNNLDSIFDGERTLERILHTVNQPFDIEDEHIVVTASIGVTFFPADDADADTLLRHADKAMYKAKAAGRSAYRVHDPVQEREIRYRLQLYKELELAMAGDQLALYYQPRVDLHSGSVVSVEALLRWHHPEHGLMLPGSFLQLADGRDLELALGDWVLERAIAQHVAWREAGLDMPVSINVVPRQLALPEFAARLARLLSRFPQEVAKGLELEILESSDVPDLQALAETLRECARLGVRFALDDFGTGYASLRRFHNLPVDILKIDREFVMQMLTDERDLGIVEGVLRLAGDLRNPVVAEGVESIEIAIMLLQLGCQFAQGFGIAHPMPAAQLPAWLDRWHGESRWHALPALVHELPGRHDFGVAVFSHQAWLSQFIACVESRRPLDPPELDHTKCTFERWYRGIGQARYGAHAAYAFLPPKHTRVHELADRIMARLRAGEHEAAVAGLGELRAASAHMVKALNRLCS
jgi:diguanylate cyclase (GGDEF)-like protein/PAS domain S-box-containing protein